MDFFLFFFLVRFLTWITFIITGTYEIRALIISAFSCRMDLLPNDFQNYFALGKRCSASSKNIYCKFPLCKDGCSNFLEALLDRHLLCVFIYLEREIKIGVYLSNKQTYQEEQPTRNRFMKVEFICATTVHIVAEINCCIETWWLAWKRRL